jgi:hypothetical protein
MTILRLHTQHAIKPHDRRKTAPTDPDTSHGFVTTSPVESVYAEKKQITMSIPNIIVAAKSTASHAALVSLR